MVARPVNVFGSMHERVGLPHATIYWASKFHCVTHNREIAMQERKLDKPLIVQLTGE